MSKKKKKDSLKNSFEHLPKNYISEKIYSKETKDGHFVTLIVQFDHKLYVGSNKKK